MTFPDLFITFRLSIQPSFLKLSSEVPVPTSEYEWPVANKVSASSAETGGQCWLPRMGLACAVQYQGRFVFSGKDHFGSSKASYSKKLLTKW